MVRRSIAACLLVLLTALAAPAGATGPYDTCDDEVAALLASVGLDESKVRSIYVSPRIVTRRNGRQVRGIDVWVRLPNCSGALIFDLTRQCTLKQAYTRGDCQVPGVSPY